MSRFLSRNRIEVGKREVNAATSRARIQTPRPFHDIRVGSYRVRCWLYAVNARAPTERFRRPQGRRRDLVNRIPAQRAAAGSPTLPRSCRYCRTSSIESLKSSVMRALASSAAPSRMASRMPRC